MPRGDIVAVVVTRICVIAGRSPFPLLPRLLTVRQRSRRRRRVLAAAAAARRGCSGSATARPAVELPRAAGLGVEPAQAVLTPRLQRQRKTAMHAPFSTASRALCGCVLMTRVTTVS